jgi:fatty acid desaturase
MTNFSEYHANENDVTEYRFKIICFTLAIFACYGTYAIGTINVIWMALITTVLVTRWMIASHELMHLKKAEELDLLTRLLPIPFAPINLGFREYRDIHLGHHRYAATANDPDAFHILGGFVPAFIGALTQHEQASYRYIRANGLSRELMVMMLVRASLFFALLLAAPLAFLAWWIVLRLTYVINDFVFFHLVHYRAGAAGNYSIPLPRYLAYPSYLIYGSDVVDATMHHDIHHQHTRIAPRYLPVVATQFNEDSALPERA